MVELRSISDDTVIRKYTITIGDGVERTATPLTRWPSIKILNMPSSISVGESRTFEVEVRNLDSAVSNYRIRMVYRTADLASYECPAPNPVHNTNDSNRTFSGVQSTHRETFEIEGCAAGRGYISTGLNIGPGGTHIHLVSDGAYFDVVAESPTATPTPTPTPIQAALSPDPTTHNFTADGRWERFTVTGDTGCKSSRKPG